MTADELLRALEGTDVPALMQRFGLRPEFVAANVLSNTGGVTVSKVAMLWMGMPNKHDRKKTAELFAALAAAGLLTCVDEAAGVWRPTARPEGS